ncbi:MAG: nucleotidyl transferase [Gammaproteobacteria bacterium]|nr:MAG: nucleotidyl transferase [Gammaproteobacteria bacterium]
MTTTAAILVGGKGTRLQSVISDVPKSLAPIAGEPFLYLLLRHLKSAGIQRVILLTGYMHDKIQAACGDGSLFGLDIIYSQEPTPLGTGGALWHGRSYLSSQNSFLLLNGDSYIDNPLTEFIQQPLEKDAIGIIGAIRSEEYERYGSLLIDKDQFITGFFEKSQKNTGLVNAGIYKFSSKLLEMINGPSSLEYDVFPYLINHGHLLAAHLLEGKFTDIGTPESYLAFNPP